VIPKQHAAEKLLEDIIVQIKLNVGKHQRQQKDIVANISSGPNASGESEVLQHYWTITLMLYTYYIHHYRNI